MIDLRHGKFRDVLADETWDHCIMDAPFGARTHRGNDNLTTRDGKQLSRPISYDCWSSVHVVDAVTFLAPRTRGWFFAMTSHDLIDAWERAFEQFGLYVFAPIPVIGKPRVRLQGDGPAISCCYAVVARPRRKEFIGWGSLPGHYMRSPGDEESPRIGGKPLNVMRAIVRDYSRPGDLICDPTAGAATTLLAAEMEGRRAIGAEADADTWAMATERIRRPLQQALI